MNFLTEWANIENANSLLRDQENIYKKYTYFQSMAKEIYEFKEEFLEYTKNEGKSQQVYDDRRGVLEALESFLKEEKISLNFDNPHEILWKLEKFFNKNPKRGATPTNIEALVSFFKFLKNRGRYSEHQLDSAIQQIRNQIKEDVEKHDEIEKVETGIVTEREKESLLKNSKDLRQELIVRILLDTGLKAGELGSLKVKDIKFGENSMNSATIEVNRYLPSKGSVKELEEDDRRKRLVAVRSETRTKLRRYIEKEDKREEDYLLWPKADYQNIRYNFEKIVDRSIIDRNLTLEPFRYNILVELIRKGFSRRYIKNYLGEINYLSPKVMENYSPTSRSPEPIASNRKIF